MLDFKEINNLIRGKTPSPKLQNLFLKTGTVDGEWIRNPECIYNHFDFSGVPVLSSWTRNRYLGCAVTRKHTISCNHMTTGGTLTWITNDNKQVNREIIKGVKIGKSDITLYELDRELPDEITHYDMPSALSTRSLYPVLFTNQRYQVSLGQSRSALKLNIQVQPIITKTRAELKWYIPTATYDSGCPIFIPSNGKLYNISQWFSGAIGPANPSALRQINEVTGNYRVATAVV